MVYCGWYYAGFFDPSLIGNQLFWRILADRRMCTSGLDDDHCSWPHPMRLPPLFTLFHLRSNTANWAINDNACDMATGLAMATLSCAHLYSSLA